ncbi:MAG: F0F1 ATP synthase subunit epsilon [Deltaproteobacteria bacterium]|nr:F0F1 ATP synthase subunit epsilon [Deltaproteobacteria bacterium]
MRLVVHVPHGPILDASALKIVAETENGFFGLLPNHVDMAAGLVPGIMTYADESGQERLLAVDRGTLVKVGPEVRVAVRNAVPGDDPASLAEIVAETFSQVTEQELKARTSVARLEVGFVRAFLNIETGGNV